MLKQKIYNSSPPFIKAGLSKLSFYINKKPKVKFDNYAGQKFPQNQKGGMIISADFELAWAWRYAKFASDIK